jgi:hypothetical protein
MAEYFVREFTRSYRNAYRQAVAAGELPTITQFAALIAIEAAKMCKASGEDSVEAQARLLALLLAKAIEMLPA